MAPRGRWCGSLVFQRCSSGVSHAFSLRQFLLSVQKGVVSDEIIRAIPNDRDRHEGGGAGQITSSQFQFREFGICSRSSD